MEQTITTNATWLAHLLALRGALHLEQLGMKRRGKSALSITKAELKISGDRITVMKALEDHIEHLTGTQLIKRYTSRSAS